MLKALEIRIPPPVIMGVVAALMIWAKFHRDLPLAHGLWLALGVSLCVIGIGIDLIALRGFMKAGTTPNPVHIERTKTLVRDGLYRYTRNPMYLGMFFTLVGLGVILSNGILLIGPLVYMFYIERLQIRPEERFLREKFGAEFEAYVKAVPRWI